MEALETHVKTLFGPDRNVDTITSSYIPFHELLELYPGFRSVSNTSFTQFRDRRTQILSLLKKDPSLVKDWL
jgi:hypothetical protein